MNPTIILNMIVRNESPVIRRCLESVKPYIDAWCIVDTGSTDDTKKIITDTMQGIPGFLYEEPWVDFGTNRSQAVEWAMLYQPKADYILTIDADEVLDTPTGFQWSALSADGYYLPVNYGNTVYARLALVSTRLNWSYKGVVHEFLESHRPALFNSLTEPKIVVYHEGARARDPKTYEKDAHILEAALEKDPTNARYMFYLAQSWKDAGHPRKAKHHYQERAKMPGWVEETWYAMYEIGRMSELLEMPVEQIQGAYLATYQYRPTRAEPLYQLARYHRERREWHLARMFAQQALEIKYPSDRLFIDTSVYQWRIQDELSIVYFYTGNNHQGLCITEELLNNPHLPESERPRVEENLKFYIKDAP
jgi:glycosyltransferase involved in cell wall biosynthesis